MSRWEEIEKNKFVFFLDAVERVSYQGRPSPNLNTRRTMDITGNIEKATGR